MVLDQVNREKSAGYEDLIEPLAHITDRELESLTLLSVLVLRHRQTVGEKTGRFTPRDDHATAGDELRQHAARLLRDRFAELRRIVVAHIAIEPLVLALCEHILAHVRKDDDIEILLQVGGVKVLRMKDRELDPVGVEEVTGPTRIHIVKIGFDQRDARQANGRGGDRDFGFKELRCDGCLVNDSAEFFCGR